MRWDPFSGTYVSTVIEKQGKRRRGKELASAPASVEQQGRGRHAQREESSVDSADEAPPACEGPKRGASGTALTGGRKAKPGGPVWIGKPTCLGAQGERFYQGVVIVDEHFHCGDDVSMGGSGDGDVYVGRIISLWETSSGEKEMELKWYYAPKHTSSGLLPGIALSALYIYRP